MYKRNLCISILVWGVIWNNKFNILNKNSFSNRIIGILLVLIRSVTEW